MLQGLTSPGETQTAARSALDKVRAVLPSSIRTQVEALRKVLGFYAVGRPPLNLDDPTFVQLQQAIDQHHVVYLHYHAQHSNRSTAREVEPLYLACVDQVWLLHGYCRLRQELRNFRLDRIDQLTVRTATFEPRPIQMHAPHEKGQRAQVRFAAEIVRWVREAQPYVFREEFPEAEDGSVTMVYEVTNIEQFTRWLLGWGAGMTVVEPAALRANLVEIAQQIVQQHESR